MLGGIKALDRILKGEATQLDSLRSGTIQVPIGRVALVTLALGAIYGACMGSFALTARWDTGTRSIGYLQMLASAAKVPLLFLLTLVVTLPSLYVFNALVGSRLTFSAVVRLMVAGLAITMAVLASFGTIVVFFSLCTTSYPFMVLLNVAMFAVAGLLGMRFLLQTLHRLTLARAMPWQVEPAAGGPSADASAAAEGAIPTTPPEVDVGALDRPGGDELAPKVKKVFRLWVLVFAIVGAQMGWVLRPFVGSPPDARLAGDLCVCGHSDGLGPPPVRRPAGIADALLPE